MLCISVPRTGMVLSEREDAPGGAEKDAARRAPLPSTHGGLVRCFRLPPFHPPRPQGPPSAPSGSIFVVCVRGRAVVPSCEEPARQAGPNVDAQRIRQQAKNAEDAQQKAAGAQQAVQ